MVVRISLYVLTELLEVNFEKAYICVEDSNSWFVGKVVLNLSERIHMTRIRIKVKKTEEKKTSVFNIFYKVSSRGNGYGQSRRRR